MTIIRRSTTWKPSWLDTIKNHFHACKLWIYNSFYFYTTNYLNVCYNKRYEKNWWKYPANTFGSTLLHEYIAITPNLQSDFHTWFRYLLTFTCVCKQCAHWQTTALYDLLVNFCKLQTVITLCLLKRCWNWVCGKVVDFVGHFRVLLKLLRQAY